MRIAFIGQKGLPAHGGGVERYVEDLALRLVQLGHDVSAYTRPHYSPAELTQWHGVDLISLPSLNTKHLDAITHSILASIHVAFQRFDVIHYQSIGPALVIWLPKLLNRHVRIVATLQSRDYEHQKWGAFAKFSLKLGERLMCLFADEIVVVTESMSRYVKETYDRHATYIPNGANLYEAVGAEKISQWNLSPENYIVAISRLVRHKGLAYLINAFKQIETDMKLVIVGDGAFSDSYVAEIKALAANDNRIIFTGNQTGETLAQLYGNAYLFVQPSESEGLSLALLEAMARRRAVLVSDITENLAAIGNTGFVFANKNTEDLKNKLSHIINNPNLVADKGNEARQRIATHFNWPVIAKDMSIVYQQANRTALLSKTV